MDYGQWIMCSVLPPRLHRAPSLASQSDQPEIRYFATGETSQVKNDGKNVINYFFHPKPRPLLLRSSDNFFFLLPASLFRAHKMMMKKWDENII